LADLERVGVKAVVEGFEAYVRQIQQVDAETARAAQGIGATAKKSDQASAAFGKIQKASAIATAGFVGLGIASVKFGMDFEHEISQVGAISNASGGDMEKLRGTALKLGADTAFSAGQAADAMEELAAGGRSVAQIIGGDAKASVDLAAAGNYGLADSARVVATAMTVWQKEGVATTDIVNRLAGAANSSRFGVDDMAQAVAMGGGVAEQAGVSFGDFTTAIAATASAFSSGSDAGTSFKTFITSLTGNSNQAKDAMKELGIITEDGSNKFYDAAGNLKSMDQIVQILHESMAGLTQEQQTVALKTIFGNDAFRMAAGLMKTTGAEFKTMSESMKNTDASEIARKRMDNLSGSVEQLKGSLETVAIKMTTAVIPALSAGALGLTSLANSFGDMPGSSQGLILGMIGITAAMPAMIGVVSKGAGMIKTLGLAAQTTKGQLSLVTAGIGALVVGADLLLQKTTGHGLIEWMFGDPRRADMVSDSMARVEARISALGANADRNHVYMQQIATDLEDWFQTEAKLEGQSGHWAGQSAVAASDFEAKLKALAKAMLEANANTDQLRQVSDSLPGSFKAEFDSLVHLNDRLVTVSDALEQETWQSRAAANAHSELTTSIDGTAAAAPKAKSAVDDFAKTLVDAEGKTLDVQKAIENLDAAFSAMNPQAAAARAESARLNEELDRIKAKGDAASASEVARATSIEKTLLPALDEEISAHDSQAKAVDGERQAVESLLGPNGYGGLRTTLMDLKVPLEDQVALNGNLSKAYYSLTHDDIPGAIGMLGTLKDKLSAPVWATLAEAVGPAVVRAIKEGYTGQEATALLGAVEQLGINTDGAYAKGVKAHAGDIAAETRQAAKDAAYEAQQEANRSAPSVGSSFSSGVAQGITLNQAEVDEAARRMAANALAAAREYLRSHSPSLRSADEVGEPIPQGVALGIQRGTPLVESAARETMQRMLNALTLGLATGQPMTFNGISRLLGDLQGLIGGSGLPDAAKAEAMATVQALAAGFLETGSLANQSLIDLINTLVNTATDGAARVNTALGGAGSGGGGGGGGGPFVTPGGWGQGGGPPTATPGTTYRNPSDVPGYANGELPAHPGYDWTNGPGGWTLVPHDYGGAAPGTRVGTTPSGDPILQQPEAGMTYVPGFGWVPNSLLGSIGGAPVTVTPPGQVPRYANGGAGSRRPGTPVTEYAAGSSYVPYTMPAIVHQGEVIERAGSLGATVAMQSAGAGAGAREINVDMRNSTFTGSPGDNRSMIKEAFREAMDEALDHEAYLYGARR
jgi:TP901 family phage tail tape measure protein